LHGVKETGTNRAQEQRLEISADQFRVRVLQHQAAVVL